MQLINYSLKVGKKSLFEGVNVEFHDQKINHLLGSNGVGKSCFAKSTIGIFPYEGLIKGVENISLIGSYSGVPLDLTLPDIDYLLQRTCNRSAVDFLFQLLKLGEIEKNLQLNKMSDGQKQKIKLWCFLSKKPKIVVLDEFTTALDKASTLDIYSFLTQYVQEEGTTIINITHNLSDVEALDGYYFYIDEKNIRQISNKEDLFKLYIQQGV